MLGPKLLKSGFDLRQPVSVGVVLLKELTKPKNRQSMLTHSCGRKLQGGSKWLREWLSRGTPAFSFDA